LKYLFLYLILLLTSCSLNKDSVYWSENSIKKSVDDKNLSKIIKETGDFKSMTYEEFNLFLKDYSNNAEYPDINK
jgi:hypothetical protein